MAKHASWGVMKSGDLQESSPGAKREGAKGPDSDLKYTPH